MWNKFSWRQTASFRYGALLIVLSFLIFWRQGLPPTQIPKSHQYELGYFHRVLIGNIYRNGGLVTSKFGMLLRLPQDGGEYYYTHHPTLFTTLLYGAFTIMGSNAFVVIPLAVSVGIVFSIYTIIAKVHSEIVGFWSAFLLAIHPLFSRYSMFINYDPLTLLLAVGSVAIFVWGVIGKQKPQWPALYGTLILAMLVDWPGYLLTYILWAYYFCFIRKFRTDKHSLALFLMPIAMFLMFLGHNVWQTGSVNGGNLFRTFIGRVSNAGEVDFFGGVRPTRPGYTNYMEFLVFLGTNMMRHIGVLYLLVGICGIIIGRLSVFRPYTGGDGKIRLFSLILFCVGIAFLLVFNSFAFYHDFSLLQVLPVFTVSAAVGVYALVGGLYHLAGNRLRRAGISRDILYHSCLALLSVLIMTYAF